MNYMVSTYNDTLFTTAAAKFAAPRLRSGWRRYGSGCAKNTL